MEEDELFTTEMRKRTRQRHDQGTVSLTKLIIPLALSSPRVYRIILLSFYWVFKTIEEEVDVRRRMHPKISPVYFPEVQRTRAFEKDLMYYYGPQYVDVINQPSKATAAYIRELKECVERDPILLLAYCHSMYLAMMGGGQLLKKSARTAFRLPKDEGTAVFEAVENGRSLPAIQKEYEEALNSIALTREEKDRIIERKLRIFECNQSLFDELVQHRSYRMRVFSVLACAFVAIVVIVFGLQSFRRMLL